ncbi:hypothetical protein FB45DRAFT_1058624 [Roridomyces roridus]|uniref:Uncharacterized protein n=1 Tax=Roridomyces roridus TaxID=1738132 RepID=A0AAD7FLE2_9AGAR|nr:hypothetical protein FB45DRAFT_1058624 [Roridomyces roridus]
MASQPRSPHTPSSIPTRTSKNLLPATRRPSFSTPGPSPTVTGVSGGFRTLRSLLPFGPKSSASPGLASPTSGVPRFASFSSGRKSRERNASLSTADLPVMVIDQANNSAELPVRKSISLYDEIPSSLETAALPTAVLTDHHLPTLNLPPTPAETAPLASPEATTKLPEDFTEESPMHRSPVFTARTPSPLPELSTIIEADTSGISKHLPSASPSPSPSPSSLSHDSPDTSALDLSTTHLTSQVMDAMTAPKPWPNEAGRSDPDGLSFNFGALDPDLAALLSPNRMVPSDSDDTIKRAIGEPVDLNKSPSLSAADGLPHQSSRPRLRPVQRPSTPPDVATLSPPRSPAVPSPKSQRRAPPSPLALSHPPSPLVLSHPPSPVPSSVASSSPLSLANTSTTAITSTPAPSKRTHNTATTSTPQFNSRRPMLGRMLESDSWESTPSARSRPSLDSASFRPSSASASTSRTSLDTARQRPSLDISRHGINSNTVRERPSESSSAWNIKLRRRKRSMSVDEQHASPPGYSSPYSESRPDSSMSSRPEWLGPRTAKAFKAAGLLGPSDSPDSNDSASSSSRMKFGSLRGSSTAGRSDSRAGSVVSPPPRRRRGSGSGSYFGSPGSQLMESPTLTMSSRDTPRSASTAPTSVSGASWGRDGDEIRELKEKHAVETGALLSALSDSQRTTKVLREENAELRDRLAQLETNFHRSMALERENQTLLEFVKELREEAGQLKLQLRLAAPVASSSRYLSQSMSQPFRLAHRNDSPRSVEETMLEDSSVFASPQARRRLSSSSSIFPVPPSNMSLLLHEDGANSSDYDDRSGVSGSFVASPTMVLGRIDVTSHRANKSIASVATTSPNASMLGSPRSLLLRPEHEVHLGDMESLDLGRPGPDEDWSE